MINLISSLAFLAIVATIIWLSRRGGAQGRREVEGAFHAVAGRLQGSILKPDWPHPPRIQFPVQGRPAILEYGGDEDYQETTRVTVDLRGCSPGFLLVVRAGPLTFIPKLFGRQDLQVGDAAFDRSFLVQANPASLAGSVFSSERRSDVIASVLRLGGLDEPTLHLTRESLTVRAKGFLTREADLLALARTALDFVQFVLNLVPVLEVSWGESKSEGGDCRICGCALEGGVVRCSRCQTPHHRDCWKYNGRCSIFGCGETRHAPSGM